MLGTTIVEAVFQNLAALLPIRVVRSYQQGVRFSLGQDRALLHTGVYFHLPWIWEVEIVDTAPQVLNLPTQTVRTIDGHSISFSGNIEFQVVDARLMYTKVQDLNHSLAARTMGHIARKIRRRTLDVLTTKQASLETYLKNTLHLQCSGWGVRINDVALTDLVQSKAFRLYGDVGTLS